MGGGEADECKWLILKLKHIFDSTLVVGPLHGAAMWKLYTV